MVHSDFSYRVWADQNGLNLPDDGAHGDVGTPHPTGVHTDVVEAPAIPAKLITLDHGNMLSTGDPWLPVGATETSGNNVIAYVDFNAPDGYGT